MTGLPKVAVVDVCNNKQHNKIVEQQELYKKKEHQELDKKFSPKRALMESKLERQWLQELVSQT